MSLKLSTSEEKQVATERRADKPVYYDANSKTEVPISADFEAYLILAPDAVKTAGATWIGATVNLQQPQVDRQALLLENLAFEAMNIAKLNTEITTILTPFNIWRESWQLGQYGDIPEVGMVVQDLQSCMAELSFAQERLRYLESSVAMNNIKVLQDGLNPDKIRQTQSWLGPLLSY